MAHAVLKFQQAQGLVDSSEDTGARVLGPRTREVLNQLIQTRYQTKAALAFEREELQSGRKMLALPSSMTVARKDEE